jgi:hypothetical protein
MDPNKRTHKQGKPLYEIIILLGHSNLPTTQIYLQLIFISEINLVNTKGLVSNPFFYVNIKLKIIPDKVMIVPKIIKTFPNLYFSFHINKEYNNFENG